MASDTSYMNYRDVHVHYPGSLSGLISALTTKGYTMYLLFVLRFFFLFFFFPQEILSHFAFFLLFSVHYLLLFFFFFLFFFKYSVSHRLLPSNSFVYFITLSSWDEKEQLLKEMAIKVGTKVARFDRTDRDPFNPNKQNPNRKREPNESQAPPHCTKKAKIAPAKNTAAAHPQTHNHPLVQSHTVHNTNRIPAPTQLTPEELTAALMRINTKFAHLQKTQAEVQQRQEQVTVQHNTLFMALMEMILLMGYPLPQAQQY
ncbi:hypothetical protein Pelo_14886 [Pelomyxa schiedti]|nr:hypothetical protein Pelo_14886 [Pelomyxa schiedti]